MTKIIHLGKRKYTKKGLAFVDDEDYAKVSQYNWYLQGNGSNNIYARSYIEGECVMMHQLVMGEMYIDHKNGYGLDNRRANLRKATHAQNSMNMRKKKNSSSKYKGVMWEKDRKKWVARIKAEGIYKNLGRFEKEEDAAEAYAKAAYQYYGEFARLS